MSNTNLSNTYALLRRTIQAVDRCRVAGLVDSELLSLLYAVEDGLSDAMRPDDRPWLRVT